MPRRTRVFAGVSGRHRGPGVGRMAWLTGQSGHFDQQVDVTAAVLMLVGLPWLARRVFGPAGDGWLARIVRAGCYLAVFGLVLVKAEVERA